MQGSFSIKIPKFCLWIPSRNKSKSNHRNLHRPSKDLTQCSSRNSFAITMRPYYTSLQPSCPSVIFAVTFHQRKLSHLAISISANNAPCPAWNTLQKQKGMCSFVYIIARWNQLSWMHASQGALLPLQSRQASAEANLMQHPPFGQSMPTFPN